MDFIITISLFTGLMASFLADKFGRRPQLIYSYIGTSIFTAIVALYFFLLDVVKVDCDTLKPYGILTFIGILGSTVISTIGFNSLIAVIPAEIFPMNVKSVAMTSTSIFGASLSFGLGRSYQLMKDCVGLFGVFVFFTIFTIAGAVFSYFCVPETKGKSLKEIQVLLQGNLYEADEVEEKLNPSKVVIDDVEIQELNELKEFVKKNSIR